MLREFSFSFLLFSSFFVLPKVLSLNCIPSDRNYCSNRGVCNEDGLTCSCDEELHYWSSERCSTWHDGRQLDVGMCCSPNNLDQYCSWLGKCNSNGTMCECFDSVHRTPLDRCANWYLDASTISLAPTPSPTIPPLSLSPFQIGETCLFVTLIDDFGDGWDNDVAFLVKKNGNLIGSLSLAKGLHSSKIEGCLPKFSSSHTLDILMSSTSNSSWLWEVKWSIQVLSPLGNGRKFHGKSESSYQYSYSSVSESYTLVSWNNIWTYPENPQPCQIVPSLGGCHSIQLQYSSSAALADDQDAGWFITSLSTNIYDYGTPWNNATHSNGSCSPCLLDGEYLLRVTGANFDFVPAISWSFCGVTGLAMNQLSFSVFGGVCTPNLPLLTLQSIVFQDICPVLIPSPTSVPTLSLSPSISPSLSAEVLSTSPTLSVTAHPSVYPENSQPSLIPTTIHSPSQSPVFFPTVSPTSRNPTIVPLPSRFPTLFSPSFVPTDKPITPSPTLVPTIAISVPVILNVSLNDFDETSDCFPIDVVVTVTPLGGSIYCASFPSSYLLTDVWVVIHQHHWVVAPLTGDFPIGTLVSSVEIQLCSLDSYVDYSVYCVATDSFGNPVTTVSDSILNSEHIYKTAPISTSITGPPIGYALRSLADYNSLTPDQLKLFLVTFELGQPPTASVEVGLVVYDVATTMERSDVSFTPTSYLFSQFTSRAALTQSFLIFGTPGNYDVKLKISGPGASAFLVNETIELVVLSGGVDTIPNLLPVISSALFDFSGARIIVSFDVPTDYAASVVDTNLWTCAKIFIFYGDDEAACVWVDSMTVVITLNYFARSNPLVLPGDELILLPNVLKGASFLASIILPFTPSSSVPVTISTHLFPTAVLLAPSEVISCHDIVLDPSLSSGQGGREWKSMKWKVFAADGSNVTEIQLLLDRVTNTDVPFSVPSSLLHVTSYIFSLGLLNFLQDDSEGIAFTSVKIDVIPNGPIVSLVLVSAAVVNVEQTSFLTLDALADLSFCSTDLTITSALSATYNWKVKKNNEFVESFISTSSNPASYIVSGDQFDLESVYQVIVEVSFQHQTSTWTSSKSIIVFGVQSSVKAMISGGISAISLSSSDILELDATLSIGENLQYEWLCRIVSPNLYGENCFASLPSPPSGMILSLPSTTFSPGNSYSITLVTTSLSTVAKRVSDSSAVNVDVFAAIVTGKIELRDPFPHFPFNTQSTLRIFSELQSQSLNGFHASWSQIGSQGFNLGSHTLANLEQDFGSQQLSSGISFPFGVYPGSFSPGLKYNFRLTLSQPGISDRFVQITIHSNSPPFGGSLSVTPPAGLEYQTEFTIFTSYWTGDIANYPFYYQFVYQIASAFNWNEPYGLTGAPHLLTHTQSILPAGLATDSDILSIAVIVSDILGADGHTTTSVIVSPPNRRQMLNTDSLLVALDTFSTATSTHQLDLMISSFQLAVNLITDVTRPDCSSSPNCENLRREECSSVSQTCGPCSVGFEGVYGDFNTVCHPVDEAKAAVGESCLINEDCFYGLCKTRVCRMPLRSCPLGDNRRPCSSHGACAYHNLQGATVPPSECTVGDANCLATCVCDTGYGGADCGLTTAEASNLEENSAKLCNDLNVLVAYFTAENRLKIAANYLLRIFLPAMNSTQCLNALSSLTSEISSNDDAEVYQQVAEVISLFSDSLVILSTVSAFQESIYANMIAGQKPIKFLTLNYRTLFTFPALDSLKEATLSLPQSEMEIAYHIPTYNLTLPQSGLEICPGFENYAKLILTLWGQSPYSIPEGSVSGNLFMATTIPTGTQASTPVNGENKTYEINLYLSQGIDITAYQSTCLQYDVEFDRLSTCDSCRITSSNSHLAHLSCDDAAAYFCQPDASAGRIYTLGVRVAPAINSYGANDSQNTMNTGVLSFISVYLFGAIVTLVILWIWDRRDRKSFILISDFESKQKQNTTFILSAAFDECGSKSATGVRLSQLAAYHVRGTSLTHDTAYLRDQKSLFVLNNPLNRSSSATVDKGGQPIPDISVQSTRRQTLESMNSIEPELIASNANDGIVLDSDAQIPPASWTELPITSLLSDHSWFDRLIHSIGRHHKWVRIFTYPSMRRTRLIRFLVAASDFLIIIFVNTIFYSIFYPDDGSCESQYSSIDDCLADHSKFDPSVPLCHWNQDGTCSLRAPPFTVKFILVVCMIVIVFSAIPRTFMQYILERICTKRPVFEFGQSNLESMLQPEPLPVNAGYKLESKTQTPGSMINRPSLDMELTTELYTFTSCDHQNISQESDVLLRENPYLDEKSEDFKLVRRSQKKLLDIDEGGNLKHLSWRQFFLFQTRIGHLQWKIRRARNEAQSLVMKVLSSSETGPNQTDFVDMSMLQHFILEQISPITRFALKKDIFEMDHASPGRIQLIPWIAAWSTVIGAWIFMAYWIISWSIHNGAGPARAWGLVLGIVVIADMMTNEFCQIYFLHVHMAQKLRPQLRDIFAVLADILEFRLQGGRPRYGGLRVPQHLSPACRASRSPTLEGILSSHILTLVDDLDIEVCRRNRLTKLQEVGFFAWMTLFHPALLNTAHDVFQQASMDLVIPIAWCCFILLNHAIVQFSPFLLIALYVAGCLFMVWFYCFVIFIPTTPSTNSDKSPKLIRQESGQIQRPNGESVSLNYSIYQGGEIEIQEANAVANSNYIALRISEENPGDLPCDQQQPNGESVCLNYSIYQNGEVQIQEESPIPGKVTREPSHSPRTNGESVSLNYSIYQQNEELQEDSPIPLNSSGEPIQRANGESVSLNYSIYQQKEEIHGESPIPTKGESIQRPNGESVSLNYSIYHQEEEIQGVNAVGNSNYLTLRISEDPHLKSPQMQRPDGESVCLNYSIYHQEEDIQEINTVANSNYLALRISEESLSAHELEESTPDIFPGQQMATTTRIVPVSTEEFTL